MEQKKKNIIWSCISVVTSLIILALAYYVMLPPVNIFATEFWGFLTLAIIRFSDQSK